MQNAFHRYPNGCLTMSGKRAVGLSAGRGLDPHIALKQEARPQSLAYFVGSGVIESNIIIGITCLLELDIDEESHNDT